jgi:hypothetical protein
MKKVSWYFYLSALVCVVFLPACQDEERSPARPGDVRFTIRSRPIDNAAGRAASVLPPDGKLYVTVLNVAGDVVFDLKEIAIATLGDYVISEPVTLSPGDYTVTQFIISNGQIGTYAAPVEGSTVAEWVDDPLPISFTVSDGILTGLEVQVLPFNEELFTPEDFGYVSFGLKVVPYQYFRLAVFKPGPNGPALDPAHAYLLDGADTLVNKTLPPGTHEIAFVGDRSKVYTLVLEDETYGVYAQSFVLDSLLNGLNGEPWAVTMKPALTMVWGGGHPSNTYLNLHPEGWYGNIVIDWGDGARDVYDSTQVVVEHNFGDKTPRVVSITGDLDGLRLLEIMGPTTALYVDHLTSLQVLVVLSDQAPKVLDLRKLTTLTAVAAPDGPVEAILLPEHHQIRSMDVSNSAFTSDGLNYLVHSLYNAAVSNGLYGGSLSLSNYRTSDPAGFVAPPSVQALEELRILRDEYQWFISPGDF